MFAQLAVMTASLMTLIGDSQATQLEVASAVLVSHDDPEMAMAQLSASMLKLTNMNTIMEFSNTITNLMNAIINAKGNMSIIRSGSLEGQIWLENFLTSHSVPRGKRTF